MKSYNCSESNYLLVNSQELDALIEETQSTRQTPIKLPDLEQLWNSVLEIFARSSEPKIYQKYDRKGSLYFEVYDPTTHQISNFKTEQEVRIWLDQRYYQ
jgi:hypothetical protein